MDEMDYFDNHEEFKKCFKCEHALLDNLNISINIQNSMFVLWNKHQIFVYEDLNFECVAKVFVPEFAVQQLIVTNNHLICLDCSGHIHTTPLKLKNSSQKRFKSTFQPRAQGILRVVQHSETHILTLGFEFDSYYLGFHTINSDFRLDEKFKIQFERGLSLSTEQQKCMITSHSISDQDLESFKDVFSETMNIKKDYSLVIFSVDKINVFGCLIYLGLSEDEIKFIKLYTSPSEICDIEIIDGGPTILIGLTIGTLVKLSFKDSLKVPKISHLNTALNKFYAYKNTVLYTDGMTMWKVENAFKDEIEYHEFFIKNVKDFIKFNDNIFTTTYTKLIYMFSIDNEHSYLRPVSTREYCSAETLLSNAEYLYKIMKEIDKNKELIEKVNDVSNHLMALALANRQDIMDKVIQTECYIYETYLEATKEHKSLTLTHKLYEYFNQSSYNVCIEISTKDLHHTLNQILSNKFGNKKIHITLSIKGQIICTNSVSLKEVKKMILLLPLNEDSLRKHFELNIEIAIVTNIPGSHDEKKDVWIVLYKKIKKMNSEQFIRNNINSSTVHCLKENVASIDDQILKTVSEKYSDIAEFSENTKKENTQEWSLYIKLPKNYKEILSNRENYPQTLKKTKLDYLFNQINQKLLESNSEIIYVVCKTKVKISVVNDEFSVTLLKVVSENMILCCNLRKFFSNIIYRVPNDKSLQQTVPSALYTTIENLQKSIRSCIDDGFQLEEFLSLSEHFYKSVIGALPL